MKLESIQKHVRAHPFRPFLIELDNGERIPVEHPENINIFMGEITVVNNGNSWLFEPQVVSAVVKQPRR